MSIAAGALAQASSPRIIETMCASAASGWSDDWDMVKDRDVRKAGLLGGSIREKRQSQTRFRDLGRVRRKGAPCNKESADARMGKTSRLFLLDNPPLPIGKQGVLEKIDERGGAVVRYMSEVLPVPGIAQHFG